MAYATSTDVATRLGRGLVAGEIDQVQALIVEASALVNGYLGRTEPFDPVPEEVSAVVTKVVARALMTADIPENVATQQQTAGPYARTVTFAGDGSALYLGATEKLMLRPFRSGMVSIATVSDRGAR